jgi:hypothetical protein
MALTKNNIESELSYAYLHAVASASGAGCQCGNRHDDNAGIDRSQTVYLPRTQVFNPDQLGSLLERLAQRDFSNYTGAA